MAPTTLTRILAPTARVSALDLHVRGTTVDDETLDSNDRDLQAGAVNIGWERDLTQVVLFDCNGATGAINNALARIWIEQPDPRDLLERIEAAERQGEIVRMRMAALVRSIALRGEATAADLRAARVLSEAEDAADAEADALTVQLEEQGAAEAREDVERLEARHEEDGWVDVINRGIAAGVL